MKQRSQLRGFCCTDVEERVNREKRMQSGNTQGLESEELAFDKEQSRDRKARGLLGFWRGQ